MLVRHCMTCTSDGWVLTYICKGSIKVVPQDLCSFVLNHLLGDLYPHSAQVLVHLSSGTGSTSFCWQNTSHEGACSSSSSAQDTPLAFHPGEEGAVVFFISLLGSSQVCLFGLVARALSVCQFLQPHLGTFTCISLSFHQMSVPIWLLYISHLYSKAQCFSGLCHCASQVDSISFWLMGFWVIKMERYSLSLIFRLGTFTHHPRVSERGKEIPLIYDS